MEAMGCPSKVIKDDPEIDGTIYLRTTWVNEGEGPTTRIYFDSNGTSM